MATRHERPPSRDMLKTRRHSRGTPPRLQHRDQRQLSCFPRSSGHRSTLGPPGLLWNVTCLVQCTSATGTLTQSAAPAPPTRPAPATSSQALRTRVCPTLQGQTLHGTDNPIPRQGVLGERDGQERGTWDPQTQEGPEGHPYLHCAGPAGLWVTLCNAARLTFSATCVTILSSVEAEKMRHLKRTLANLDAIT